MGAYSVIQIEAKLICCYYFHLYNFNFKGFNLNQKTPLVKNMCPRKPCLYYEIKQIWWMVIVKTINTILRRPWPPMYNRVWCHTFLETSQHFWLKPAGIVFTPGIVWDSPVNKRESYSADWAYFCNYEAMMQKLSAVWLQNSARVHEIMYLFQPTRYQSCKSVVWLVDKIKTLKWP